MLNEEYEKYQFERLNDLLILTIQQCNSLSYNETRVLLGVMLEIVENHLKRFRKQEVRTA